jgi:hypothetical protein
MKDAGLRNPDTQNGDRLASLVATVNTEMRSDQVGEETGVSEESPDRSRIHF